MIFKREILLKFILCALCGSVANINTVSIGCWTTSIKNHLLVFIMIILLPTALTGCLQGNSSKGSSLNPQRIISLAPSNTEILYALGLEDRIVGVTDYCRYPVEAQQKQSVGGFINPNLETIVMLEPDLVATIREHTKIRERIEKLNIKTVTVPNRSIKEISQAFVLLGRVTGRESEGIALKKSFLNRMDLIKRRFSSRKKRRVMLVVGRSPGTLKGMYVAGPGNFYHELLHIVNAENIFRDSFVPYFQPSFEEIYARNPEIIIELKMEKQLSHEEKERVIRQWYKLKKVDAVINKRVFLLNDQYYTVPGMSLLKILNEFCRIME